MREATMPHLTVAYTANLSDAVLPSLLPKLSLLPSVRYPDRDSRSNAQTLQCRARVNVSNRCAIVNNRQMWTFASDRLAR
jgi:hypothetical protein